ncbi:MULTISPECIES: hypothetical protein [unclassified Bradyrhizobium]|uniref:hypothetical protein n=1 Tax=unclassified Bradyrhizobium TaxID=2631580 RepID=UPI00247B075C|nr:MULTISPECIES: hypothetical protein [unclassified Bradyrhizobium]WGR71268.1 hypothetical protein MTX24_39210 [Bradyrhizobium sp. ISRA426]WGR76103.1 hypothetical protein MTX21_24315 [Bradyrhizobium sp. ISRA430]WGR86508.1 hypothetical protein MTX25_38900 [Bradyrhizobium sp. ISRA432]
MGHITMPQVIVDAPRRKGIVIRNDDGNSCESAGSRVKSDQVRFLHSATRRPAAPLWLAATLVVMCLSDAPGLRDGARAQSNGIAANSQQLGPAKTGNTGDARPAGEQVQSVETLARELATTRRDIESLQGLLSKEREESARVENALQSEAAELRQSLKELSQGGAADQQKSLREERGRAARLEQDLAAARRDVETLTALAVKASDEAARLRQAPQNGGADVQKSLEQERTRSARLERDLAAARRDVETLAALAVKASSEAARLKQAPQSGGADLQKALEQEVARTARLEQDLAAARREVEKQAAPAVKAGDGSAGPKPASQSGAADLQKALEQERARIARLEQDLAAARREVEKQAALAAKASEEAAELKRAAQSGAVDLRKSLEQEHERAARLEQDLAAARRDVETQAALTAKAGDELARLKQAEASAAELRRSMQKEHERADALAQDLSMARTKIYAYEAQAAKAKDEAAQHKQAEVSDTAELRQSLQRERQRAEQLARDLATRSRELDAQAERAAEANAQVAGTKQAAEQAVAEQRSLLQRERQRAEQLARDLATRSRELDAQAERAAKANAQVAGMKQAAAQAVAEQRSLLLASARRDIGAFAANVPSVAPQVINTVATSRSVQEQPASAPVASTEAQATVARTPGNAELNADDGVQEARLMARARLLLERGDVGGARIVLERVAEMGSAQASFALAETYDPLILSSWGTYGTRGDAAKARDLYAKAEAGGIKEAKARFEALRR